MPETTENYHWIPVRDAGLFLQNSFRQIDLSADKGIHARIGKLKSEPDGSTVVQSYYFDKDQWSMDEANAWVKDHKKSASGPPERRCFEHMVRMDYEDQKKPQILGYAAIFNQRTELWPGFYEEIAPGAFKDAINSENIYALFNHDPSAVLGNTGAKTLKLIEDEKGLAYQITPPDTGVGKDVTTLIKRGDIRKSSFGFSLVVDGEDVSRINDGKDMLRIIRKVESLYDVSPVTYPAYSSTEAHVRMTQFDNITLIEDRIIEFDPPKVEEKVDEESNEDFLKRVDEFLKKEY